MSGSRKKNTIMSAAVNIADQGIALIFGLLVPRLVIGTYGSSVNGLTSFVNQLLSIFQLLQAGTVGASIYALFKPIAEKDYDKINIVVDSSRRFFNKVGTIFFTCVFILAPIMVFIQKDSGFQPWEIIATTIIMGINGGLTFFFDSRYDIILSSYQKRYVLYSGDIIRKLVYYTCLLTAVLTKRHFVLMYVSSFISQICYILFLRYHYEKIVKCWIKPLKENTYKVPNKGYLFSNQIVQTVINALPVILVSSFYGLAQNSVYSLNISIVNIAKTILFSFMYAVTEPFGNFIQNKDSKEVYKMYDKIHFGMIYAETFVMTCVICLLNPFIRLYTIGINDVNYNVPILVVFLVLDAIANVFYRISLIYIDVYGLYKELCGRMIAAGILGICFMFLTGKFIGYEVIPLASSLYYLIVTAICYFIAQKYDRSLVNIRHIILRMILVYGFSLLSFLITRNLFSHITSWLQWLLASIVLAFFVAIVLFIFIIIFEREKFKLIKDIVKKIFHK